MRPRTDHKRTHDKRRTTHGEKFVKSGQPTDNAHGQIQDRPNIFNGSNISPPTHHKTNKFCYVKYGSRTSTRTRTRTPNPSATKKPALNIVLIMKNWHHHMIISSMYAVTTPPKTTQNRPIAARNQLCVIRLQPPRKPSRGVGEYTVW